MHNMAERRIQNIHASIEVESTKKQAFDNFEELAKQANTDLNHWITESKKLDDCAVIVYVTRYANSIVVTIY